MKLVLFDFSHLTYNKIVISIVLFCFSLISIITIDYESVITFLLFLFFALFVYRVTFQDKDPIPLLNLFFLYTILAVIIYWMQYIQFPQNGGCTGENIHGGTDDLFFFQEATNNGVSYRGDRSSFIHPYSAFLQVFFKIISSYKKVKLIDLLFVNIFAFSFIPILTKKIGKKLKLTKKSLDYAFIFTAFCPILITNGLVLIRDGWTTVLFLAGILFLFEKKFIFLTLTFFLLFYLRIGSGVILLSFLIMILFFSNKKDLPNYNFAKKGFYLILISLILIFSIPAIMFFLKSYHLLDSNFFRKDFLAFIKESSSENSAANYIFNLPLVLRIPIGSFFYFGTPFLSLKDLWYNNFFTIRSLIEFIFPFLFILHFKYFLRSGISFFSTHQRNLLNIFFVGYIIFIVVLSQMSMQPKHKTMLMPIFYLISSTGINSSSKVAAQISQVIVILFFLLEIMYAFVLKFIL